MIANWEEFFVDAEWDTYVIMLIAAFICFLLALCLIENKRIRNCLCVGLIAISVMSELIVVFGSPFVGMSNTGYDITRATAFFVELVSVPGMAGFLVGMVVSKIIMKENT